MPLGIYWPDAELESIAVDYDKVSIALSESTGRRLLVTASGHIGINLIGFWDEMVVETAELLQSDPVIDRCLAAVRSRQSEPFLLTGCADRNVQDWALLRIRLIDGCDLEVVASRFEVHTTH